MPPLNTTAKEASRMSGKARDPARMLPLQEQRERIVFRADLRLYSEDSAGDAGSFDPLIDSIIRRHLAVAEREIRERRPGTRLELLTMPGQRLG